MICVVVVIYPKLSSGLNHVRMSILKSDTYDLWQQIVKTVICPRPDTIARENFLLEVKCFSPVTSTWRASHTIPNVHIFLFLVFTGSQGIVTSNHIKSLLFTIECSQIPSSLDCSRVPGHSCHQKATNSDHTFPASRRFGT